MLWGSMCTMHAPCAYCTLKHPDCYPLPKWPLKRANTLATTLGNTPPSHRHSTIKSTIELAPTSKSLKWPLACCGPMQS